MHTSSLGIGRFISGAGDPGAVAAVQVGGQAASVADGLLTRWWLRFAGSGCGNREDERSDERGDQGCEE